MRIFGFLYMWKYGRQQVFDDEHISLWERGRGSTAENLTDGTEVTIFFRKPQLRAEGLLPKGGIPRFYGPRQGFVRDPHTSAFDAGAGGRA